MFETNFWNQVKSESKFNNPMQSTSIYSIVCSAKNKSEKSIPQLTKKNCFTLEMTKWIKIWLAKSNKSYYNSYFSITTLSETSSQFTFYYKCLSVIKGCVRYIFASLFFKSNREHLRNKEKCFFFTSKALFIPKFYNFRYSNFMLLNA